MDEFALCHLWLRQLISSTGRDCLIIVKHSEKFSYFSTRVSARPANQATSHIP